MKRLFGRKSYNNRSVARVIVAALVGSVVGAVVGLLMAPTSGAEMRRKLSGGVKDARERAKTAAGNIESRARELAEEVTSDVNNAMGSVSRRRKVVSTSR
jgi:gas vesicle protein